MSRQVCLKWNNHTSNLLEVFDSLLSSEAFVDVTLACDGLSLKAHKIVLSASSPFFKNLFLENPSKHPIVILKDIKFCDLKSVIKFIYSGEVSISRDELLSFLLTAETLKVKGLEKVTAENRHALGLGEQKNSKQTNVTSPKSPPVKQARKKPTRTSFKGKKKSPLRKRLLDSSLSDEEGVIAKLTREASPDVVDLSSDLNLDLRNDIYSGSGPSSLFMVSLRPSNSAKSKAKKSGPSTSRDTEIIEDDVDELEVEPSNLLEQTLIVDNASSTTQDNSDHTLLPTISGIETVTESINDTDVFNESLISTPDSNLLTPDITEDMKPDVTPLEDVSISPVAGPSQSSPRSWMQIDNFDVSLISKTKNSKKATPIKAPAKRKVRPRKKPAKKDSEIKQEPWKQVLHMCSDCSYTNGNIEELVSHIEFHKKAAIQCEFCKIDFTELRSSEHTPEVNKHVVDCDICDHCFCSKMALLTHKLLHHY